MVVEEGQWLDAVYLVHDRRVTVKPVMAAQSVSQRKLGPVFVVFSAADEYASFSSGNTLTIRLSSFSLTPLFSPAIY